MASNDDDMLLKDLLTSSIARGKRVDHRSDKSKKNKNDDWVSFGDHSSDSSEQHEKKSCDDDSSDSNHDNSDSDRDSSGEDEEAEYEPSKKKEHCIPKRKISSSRRGKKYTYLNSAEEGEEGNCSSTVKRTARKSSSETQSQIMPEDIGKTSTQMEIYKKVSTPLTPLKQDKRYGLSSHGIEDHCAEHKKRRLTLPEGITVFRDIRERGTLYNIRVHITRSWYGMLYGRAFPASFTFIARDEEGLEREVVTDDSDAQKWKKLISVDKVYAIKNVVKLMTTRPTKVVNAAWQLSMTKQSNVDNLSDKEISAGPNYKFQKLVNVASLARKNEYIHDILAYVIDVGHPRTFSMKRGGTCKLVDAFLVDDSCYEQPIKLTIWEDVLNKYSNWFGRGRVNAFPIVAIGIRAKFFREEPQLESTRFTKIKFEVQGVPEAEEFMKWILLKLPNKQLSHRHEASSSSSSNPNQTVKSCTIADLINETQLYPTTDKALIFIVHATVTDIYADAPFMDVCSQCNRAVRVQSGRDYQCAKCGYTGKSCNKKLKIKARIEDATDQTDIVAFEQQAEILLHLPTADVISLYTSREDNYEYERHLNKCSSVAYKMKLKVTRENYKFIQSGGGFTVSSLERIVSQFPLLGQAEEHVEATKGRSHVEKGKFDGEDQLASDLQ